LVALIQGLVAPGSPQAAVAEVSALADRSFLLVDAHPDNLDLLVLVVAAAVIDDPAYVRLKNTTEFSMMVDDR
jgi:hypothetical protein